MQKGDDYELLLVQIMQIFYSDHYPLPLPENHRFPGGKYKMLKDFLLDQQIITPFELMESPIASEEMLCLAHTQKYVQSVQRGDLDSNIIKRIGFPWSHELYIRSCAVVGGAVEAAKSALKNKISGNLAGGTHHAHADRGEGYCVFNDMAIATRYLHQNKLAKRIAIIDLDVHQGNGNSSILKNDLDVFIFSMHGEKDYPIIKVPSHLDIALPTGASDQEFLGQLRLGMQSVINFKPDYIFYQTGVDPLKEDLYGKMDLTLEGLIQRDSIILQYAFDNHIPISLALGGGYAKPIELSVEAYANTYRVAKKIYGNQI